MKVAWMLIGTVGSILLVVAALWAWGQAWPIADKADRPDVAVWAVRCAALAAAAGAQVMLLTLVVGALYRRGLLDDILRLAAALVCTLAVVSAAALALAGK